MSNGRRRSGCWLVSGCVPATLLVLFNPALEAQGIPVRELDTNGLVTGELPWHVLGGVAVGEGFVTNGSTTVGLPVRWDASGSQLLPLLAGDTQGWAYGLNSAGTIVGTSIADITSWHPIVWSQGTVVDLNTLVTGGDPLLLQDALAVDEQGRIACDGALVNGRFHACLFDGGIVDDLGTAFGPNAYSGATAMDEHGIVVGYSLDAAGTTFHATRFDHGATLDLHDPSFMAGKYSVAYDINRAGHIVGLYSHVSPPGNDFGAFFWDGTQAIDLGATVAGSSSAWGVNDFDVVVGSFDLTGRNPTACQWDHGALTDLNTLLAPGTGWVLTIAQAIDNEGRVVGRGRLNGVLSGFILEPDCKGRFTIYGTGCAGTGGVEPRMLGTGCPAPERDFALSVVDGLASATGLLLVGSGTGSARIKPGCDAQVLPLVVPPFALALDGFGEAWWQAHLPAGTPPFDLYLQPFFFDPGAPYGLSATKPVQLHFE